MLNKKFFSLILLFILVLTGPRAFAKDELSINSLVIESELRPNGDLYVVEDIKYNFKKDFNGIARNISVHSKDGIEDLHIVLVEDGKEIPLKQVDKASKTDDMVFTIKKSKSKIAIKIFSPSEMESSKSFRISYLSKNVATKHQDIGDLYYRFVGKENGDPIDFLSATIRLPSKDRENTKYFVHAPGNPYIELIEEDLLFLEAENVPAHSNVEGRILFPLDYIKDSNNRGKLNLEKIIKEENNYLEIKEDSIHSKERTKRVQEYLSIGTSFLLILMIGFFYKFTKRKANLFDSLDSLVAKDLSPAEIRLFTNSNVMDSKGIVASILDLAKRGYIKIEALGSDNKEFSLAKLENSTKDLLAHEEYLMKWLFSEIGNGKKVSTTDIDDFRKRSYRKFSTNFTVWNKRVSKNLVSRGYFAYDHRMGAVGFSFSTISFILGIVTLIYGVKYGILTSLLAIVAFTYSLKVFTKKSDLGFVEHKLWMDYKKALETDISSLGYYQSIPSEDVLIHGIGLGLNMKTIEPIRNSISKKDLWSNFYFLENSKEGSSFEDSLNAAFYGITSK